MTGFLYGYGNRKHIHGRTDGNGFHYALCGFVGDSEDDMQASLRRWNGPAMAEKWIEKKHALKVCGRCGSGR